MLPGAKLDVVLVRHGETWNNARGVIQGQSNSSLNGLSDEGRAQAVLLARRLRSMRFDAVYSSDLLRAVQTTEEIIKFHSQTVVFDPRLREKSGGIYEGEPLGTQEKAAARAQVPERKFRPQDGESWDDVYERAQSFFWDILKHSAVEEPPGPKGVAKSKSANSTQVPQILVVTHGGFIKEFLNWVQNHTKQCKAQGSKGRRQSTPSSVKRAFPNENAARNTALFKLRVSDFATKIALLVKNDVSHLNKPKQSTMSPGPASFRAHLAGNGSGGFSDSSNSSDSSLSVCTTLSDSSDASTDADLASLSPRDSPLSGSLSSSPEVEPGSPPSSPYPLMLREWTNGLQLPAPPVCKAKRKRARKKGSPSTAPAATTSVA